MRRRARVRTWTRSPPAACSSRRPSRSRSWTLPSVSTLFTGLHPRSHGAIGDDGDGDDQAAWGYLSGGVTTWAEEASRAGITTVGVSANPLVSHGTNLAQGFETFVELPWDAKTRRWSAAAEVNRRFLDWLALNHQHRFVAWLQYMEPHDPYTPPPSLRPSPPPGMRADLAAGWVLDVSRQLGARTAPPLPPEQIEYLRALYDGEIHSWDAELPALLAGLDRLGLRDSTVIVVTADHGEEFQEHGLLLHRAHIYDELLHVPLAIAGPGVAHGRRTDQVQGIDLFPTLAALLGVDVPPGLPGHNLLGAVVERPAISETDGLANDGSRADLVAVRTSSLEADLHAVACELRAVRPRGRPGRARARRGRGGRGTGAATNPRRVPPHRRAAARPHGPRPGDSREAARARLRRVIGPAHST